jgi:hypothetical protein
MGLMAGLGKALGVAGFVALLGFLMCLAKVVPRAATDGFSIAFGSTLGQVTSGLGIAAIVLIAVSMRLTPSPPLTLDEIYERIYRKAERRGLGALTEREKVIYQGRNYFVYIEGDGFDGGVDNMGVENVQATFPTLEFLGLHELRKITEEYFDILEKHPDNASQAETDEYFRKCRALEQRARGAGLMSIPERLEAYWNANGRR